jgi:hypothetical protein
MNLKITKADRSALQRIDPKSRQAWLALEDDVKAGHFEEILELAAQGRAEEHWAWPFVKPFVTVA